VLPLLAAAPRLEREPGEMPARERSRAALGLPPEARVLLTVASPYKLRPLRGRDLRELVSAEVADQPDAWWLVAGPAPGGEWQPFEQRAGGRVRCLGVRSDLELLYSAADLYLDSWPFTSQTALRDAAAHGLPLLAVDWHGPGAVILGARGSSLDPALIPLSDAASLREAVRLAADPPRRRAAGRLARTAAAQGGKDAAWRRHLDAVYRLAAERSRERGTDGRCAVGAGDGWLDGEDELDAALASIYRGDEPWRAFVKWHRDITNEGAAVAFPGAVSELATAPGLAGLVGDLEQGIRDLEALVACLERTAQSGVQPPP
jgi:hypothetical protein